MKVTVYKKSSVYAIVALGVIMFGHAVGWWA